MEEGVKNRIILILSITSLLFLMISVKSCSNTRSARSILNEEKSMRWDLEQKTRELTQQNKALEEKVKIITQELEDEKTANSSMKKTLDEEQLAAKALKDELQKMNELKNTLEEDLKEALGKKKAEKSNKK
ncbi:MAG: hypothetical protein PHE58_05640 [Candidatus Omnitrophica bacterium]|nr:hypothetical protein [Candidatus Omnitrophota bacterium]